MGFPGPYPPPYPNPPYQNPPSPTSDRVVSIIALVLAALVVAGGAFMGVMMLAFLDYCPEATCSVSGAVNAVVTSVGIAVVMGVGGLVLTAIRLGRRRTAWPFAVGTLVLCGLTFVAGGFAFGVAVGG